MLRLCRKNLWLSAVSSTRWNDFRQFFWFTLFYYCRHSLCNVVDLLKSLDSIDRWHTENLSYCPHYLLPDLYKDAEEVGKYLFLGKYVLCHKNWSEWVELFTFSNPEFFLYFCNLCMLHDRKLSIYSILLAFGIWDWNLEI